jgi:hypothetical protein
MDYEDDIGCEVCYNPMRRMLTTGMVKRPDASWVADINGTINDLGEAQKGKQEYITTREQARKHIKHAYRDPHPKVQELKKRYLERF